MSKHQYFDITVDTARLDEDIFRVFQVLRPKWTKKDRFSRGLLNTMVCFYQKWDEKRSDGFVVRVHGSSEVQWSRETEIFAMQFAHRVGCFPPLAATFNNGLIYPYIQGRVATYNDLTQPAVIKKLTRLIYDFQHFDIQQQDLFDRKGNRARLPDIGSYLDLNFRIQDSIPDKAVNDAANVIFQEVRRELTDEVIKREQDFLRTFENGFQEKMVLCHGDLHPGNILINDDTGEITLLDYEYTVFNFGVYDIRKIWYLRFFFGFMGICDKNEPDFNDEVKRLYFQGYIEAKHKHMGDSEYRATDNEIDILSIQEHILETMYNGCYMMTLLTFVNHQFGGEGMMNAVLLFKENYLRNTGVLSTLQKQYLEQVSAIKFINK